MIRFENAKVKTRHQILIAKSVQFTENNMIVSVLQQSSIRGLPVQEDRKILIYSRLKNKKFLAIIFFFEQIGQFCFLCNTVLWDIVVILS